MRRWGLRLRFLERSSLPFPFSPSLLLVPNWRQTEMSDKTAVYNRRSFSLGVEENDMATWRQNGRCSVELHLVCFAHIHSFPQPILSTHVRVILKRKNYCKKKRGGISRQLGALVQCHHRPFGKK